METLSAIYMIKIKRVLSSRRQQKHMQMQNTRKIWYQFHDVAHTFPSSKCNSVHVDLAIHLNQAASNEVGRIRNYKYYMLNTTTNNMFPPFIVRMLVSLIQFKRDFLLYLIAHYCLMPIVSFSSFPFSSLRQLYQFRKANDYYQVNHVHFEYYPNFLSLL